MFAASKTAAAAAGTPPPSTDPQFNYVTMLLHGDGTNGAQNNTFVDSSTNNFTITRNGTPTQGSFSPYGDLWSNQFSGSGQYLKTPSNAAFAYGTGDFTWEMWIYPTASDWTTGNRYMLDHGSNGGTFQYYQNNLRYYNPTVGEGVLAKNAGPVSANTWTHIAVSRASGTTRIFIDGVLKVSASDGHNYGNNVVTVSDYGSGGYAFAGYLSNVRIVKGTALYTSNFTPSTTPLTAVSGTSLLTCQSNRFRDNSSNNFAITVTGTPSVQRFSPFDPAAEYSTSVIGGSGYFNGSSQYLTTTANSGLGLGTGDFTIEYWVWPTSVSNGWTVVDFRASTSFGDQGFTDYLDSGRPAVYYNPAASSLAISSIALTANAWNHVAFSRSSGTLRIFVNGAQGFNGSVTSNFGTSQPLGLGANINRNQFWNGYITNLRVVKGSAVYTTTFTPPTAPLTAITNTSLLLNFTNAGIFDNAMMNDLVTVGNAQVSTAVKKYGTGSMAFDGSGDYIDTTTAFTIGSGDFTIEGWFYFNSFLPTVLDNRFGTYSSSMVLYDSSGSGLFALYLANANRATFQASTGQWYHIAICKAAGTTRFFVNGVQQGSNYTDSNNYSSGKLRLGANLIAGNFLNGYIDDFRISQGVARYTANFTAPTAAFPNN